MTYNQALKFLLNLKEATKENLLDKMTELTLTGYWLCELGSRADAQSKILFYAVVNQKVSHGEGRIEHGYGDTLVDAFNHALKNMKKRL